MKEPHQIPDCSTCLTRGSQGGKFELRERELVLQAAEAIQQALVLRAQQGAQAESNFVWPLDAVTLEASFPQGMQLTSRPAWSCLNVVRPTPQVWGWLHLHCS